MLSRKHYCVLTLLLLPIEFSASADANEWTAAPTRWTDGLDVGALCRPGEWFFEPFGDQVRVVEPASSLQSREISAARVFLRSVGKRGASWIADGPKADELTTLRIARNEDGELTIKAYTGTLLAAWRVYKPESTTCQPGMSLRINTDVEGGHAQKTSLALANDGSLILRQDTVDDFSWPLLTLPMWSFYARFPAADTEGGPPNPAN